jgi:hypothetical protein
MTEIPVEEALGCPLAHDLTQIDAVAGTKGARFRKGQVLVPADLPVLRSMGREHLSVLELEPDEVHEDDAALALAERLTGEGVEVRGPREGRCSLFALSGGLLEFDPESVCRINADPDWCLATLPPRRVVRRGDMVAGFRIRPLAVREQQLRRALAEAVPFRIRPFRPLRAGLVTTGREILEGRIADAFLSKFERKVISFGGSLAGHHVRSDEPEEIASAIRDLLDRGAELVVCSGGMSVDADDRTPAALRMVADRVVFQGIPVLPGSMLMLAYVGSIPLVGAPACVVHDEWTSLDRLLPLLFAGLDPEGEVRRWGVGGLCAHCEVCNFPTCPFSGA